MSINETNALWNVWNDRDPIEIPNTEYTLKGFSVAALRTNFYIKELGVMLDGGLSANIYADHIFITHAHSDHIASLPFHLYSVKPESKIQIYAPEEACKNLDQFIQSLLMINMEFPDGELNNNENQIVNEKCYDLIPLKPSTFELNIKNKVFKIEAIKCYHGVPCLGYGFIEKRNKLKQEYLGLSPKEIGMLKKRGIDICIEVEFPIFCFLGDTSKEILNDTSLEKYKTIMIECTFITDDDIEQANKTSHMHWKSLEPYILSHPSITFILYHFSRRYKKSDLEIFFKKMDLQNVIAWIN